MLNLCEDRYRFLVSYAAALSVGHAVLMPPSRAEQVVSEIAAANRGSYRWQDADVAAARAAPSLQLTVSARIPARQTVMIGFTSGSTGQPKTYPKLWSSVHGSTARNAAAIRQRARNRGRRSGRTIPAIVATVPPQHMYGMELSILLPLIGGMAVHAGRPLFPADIARALAELPAPRVLVSTPLHLRTLVESSQPFPTTALIISATAPLDQDAGRGSRSAARRAIARAVRLDRDVRVRQAADRDGGSVASVRRRASCTRARTARWSQHRGSSSRCCCRIS